MCCVVILLDVLTVLHGVLECPLLSNSSLLIAHCCLCVVNLVLLFVARVRLLVLGELKFMTFEGCSVSDRTRRWQKTSYC